jgi:hypothetical protein
LVRRKRSIHAIKKLSGYDNWDSFTELCEHVSQDSMNEITNAIALEFHSLMSGEEAVEFAKNVLDFISQDHYHVIPGMTISDTDEEQTYKDRIIITDAGFYWDSDTEGEQPLSSEDIINIYNESKNRE